MHLNFDSICTIGSVSFLISVWMLSTDPIFYTYQSQRYWAKSFLSSKTTCGGKIFILLIYFFLDFSNFFYVSNTGKVNPWNNFNFKWFFTPNHAVRSPVWSDMTALWVAPGFTRQGGRIFSSRGDNFSNHAVWYMIVLKHRFTKTWPPLIFEFQIQIET